MPERLLPFTAGSFVLALLFFLAPASAQVQKIGPDLYAYISENDSSANSTFLISSQGILVVDTGLNETEGRKLLAEIRKLSSLPVRYIVNTHYHPDHRGGNGVVGPDATIIATKFTFEQQTGKATAASSHSRIVVDKRLRLTLGKHQVVVLFLGPAHTMGDVVVYFPDDHAIATGDLFLTNSCPAMDRGNMENWIAALDSILQLPVNAVVPGHFELAGKDDLRRFRNYLADLRDQVATMFRSGAPLEEVKQKLNLGQYQNFRQFPKYEATFADNAAAYYQQLQQREKPGSSPSTQRK